MSYTISSYGLEDFHFLVYPERLRSTLTYCIEHQHHYRLNICGATKLLHYIQVYLYAFQCPYLHPDIRHKLYFRTQILHSQAPSMYDQETP
jgi:hypothetical protein